MNTSIAPVLPAGNALALSYDQAASFVNAITGNQAATALIDWRAIHDEDRSRPAIPFRATLVDAWSAIAQHNNNGYGIFAVIAELDGKGRELSNVTAIRAQYIDLDNVSAQANYERATAFNLSPAFAVQSSPQHYHVYWTVQPFAGNDRFTVVQRKLRQLFNGDGAVIDAARVMRLPGSYHLKNPQQPHLVTCWRLEGFGRHYDIGALEIALADINVIKGAGSRHELGEPTLAAPSLNELAVALHNVDPNTLDRSQWISMTAAFKQSGWTLGSERQLFEIWSTWCARYDGNDTGENEKQWSSLRSTEVGWPAIHWRAYGKPPRLDPLKILGNNGNVPPLQPGSPPPPGDGYVEIISTATGDNGKNTLIETVKVLHGNLPVAFDEFTQTVLAMHPLPWDRNSTYPRQWTELDTIHCQLYVQALFVKPGKDTVHDAVAIIANRHKRHQVRDYLNSITWDGVQRLPQLAGRYFGAADTPYSQTIAIKFMIGAVARIMQPGCKMDNVVILEGKQGSGKSSAIAMLAGPLWFTDELPDLHTKDAAIQLAGKWIIELSELSALRRADIETIKKFMARSTDTYRAPYERSTGDHPRQSVFIATTNDEHYLKDQTGNRRFWPLMCGTINVAAIRRDRDQLWAEAFTRYRAGERWWLDSEQASLAEAEQDERRELDPWEERIGVYAASLGSSPVTISQVSTILGIPFERMNSSVNKRIAHGLMRAGYVRKQIRCGNDRSWQYVRNS